MKATWIAEEHVVFRFKDGQRALGRIAVGIPVEGSAGEWGCAVALDGFETLRGPIYGASSLQALLLALRLVAMRLEDHLAKGGHILDPHDDREFPLDAVFGPLVTR